MIHQRTGRTGDIRSWSHRPRLFAHQKQHEGHRRLEAADFWPQACMLVSYIASMFLRKRLRAAYYVYFASLDDVCTQIELDFFLVCVLACNDLRAVAVHRRMC